MGTDVSVEGLSTDFVEKGRYAEGARAESGRARWDGCSPGTKRRTTCSMLDRCCRGR